MNAVTSDSFLTLHYRLSGSQGVVLSTFEGKPATLSIGTGEWSPAIEQCLIGMNEGARQKFTIEAGLAFGEHQADKLQWVAGALLDELNPESGEYQIGDVVQFPTPDGLGSFAGAVIELQQNRVLFDFNHPLAGQAVELDVQILGIL